MQRWTALGVVLSLAAHAGIGAAVSALPKDVVRKHSLVSVVEKKKKEEKKKDEPVKDEPPPPPPPKKEPPRPAPKKAPEAAPPPPPANAPPPTAAAHPQLAALPSLGISMSGGTGGIGGIAIPVGPTGPEPGPAAPAAEAPKAAAKAKDDCTEDPVKPKPLAPIAQAGVMAASQAASVYGKIRLEILVDETGNPSSVRVMSGLGGAIDEAAIAAAKRTKFTPSTRCGRPVSGRYLVGFRLDPPE